MPTQTIVYSYSFIYSVWEVGSSNEDCIIICERFILSHKSSVFAFCASCRPQTPYPRNPHPSVNKHSAWWLTLFVSWPPDCVPLCFANSKFESSCSVSSSGSFSSNFSFLCRYFFARGVWGGGNGIRVRVSFFFRYRFDLRSSLKSKIDWFARFVSRMQQMETSTDKTP